MLSKRLILPEEKLNTSKFLLKFSKLIDPKYKIARYINRVSEHFDDPKFFHFVATLFPISNDPGEDNLSNSVSGYSFFSEEEALLKCIGEALERYCIRKYDRRKFIKTSYKLLGKKAVNPKSFVTFSKSQMAKLNFAMFRFDNSTPFNWIKGVNLANWQQIFVPAQLIYLSYKLAKDEKWIYLPISTGTAGGTSIGSSIVRAIYELIERDAFLIFYLNKLPGAKVDLKSIKDAKINFCTNVIESYNLGLHCFDITTELKVPTFLSVVLDETGIGPAVSLGLKTNFDSKLAILGSIQEALHPRGWIRKKVEENPKLLEKIRKGHITTLEDRALLWYSREKIKKLNFLLNQSAKKIPFEKINNYSYVDELKMLLQMFKKNNMDVLHVDVTTPIIKQMGYYVSRILIPQLYPFYLIEDFPYHGGRRLYDLPKDLGFSARKTNEKYLNKFPHPFI